jgi:hypothetical protein
MLKAVEVRIHPTFELLMELENKLNKETGRLVSFFELETEAEPTWGGGPTKRGLIGIAIFER